MSGAGGIRVTKRSSCLQYSCSSAAKGILDGVGVAAFYPDINGNKKNSQLKVSLELTIFLIISLKSPLDFLGPHS